MQSHGDRIADAKPLNEILAEPLPEEADYGEQGDDTFPGAAEDALQWARNIEEAPPMYSNSDEAMRLTCAHIAALSFGATGSFDNDTLLFRANNIFAYVKNGL